MRRQNLEMLRLLSFFRTTTWLGRQAAAPSVSEARSSCEPLVRT